MKQMTTRTALIAAMLALPAALTHADTATFADGVGGYAGATDIYIPRAQAVGGDGAATAIATDNPPVDQLWIDQDGTGGTSYGAVIYKYADVFGNAAGQVDLGAEIVSATLSITSGSASTSADTTGDPRVHGLLGPASVATTFQDLSGLDTLAQTGSSAYLYPNGSSGLLTPWQSFYDAHGDFETLNYDVSSYIRSISSGAVSDSNLALLAINNNTNGWQVFTSIALDPASRPTLTIEFNDARMQKQTILGAGAATVYELGDQGTDVGVQKVTGGVGIDFVPEIPDDDGTPENEFVASSQNEQGLIKFDLSGVVPAGAQLQQARLVLTTAIASNAQSGDFNNQDAGINIRQMLVDWDTTSLPTEFGSEFGIQASEGEASTEYVDMNGNFLDGSNIPNAGFDSIGQGEEFSFDVSEIVQAWLDGEENYGFVVSKEVGSDGWQFEAGNVALYLDYSTVVPEPSSLALLGLGGLLIARRRRN